MHLFYRLFIFVAITLLVVTAPWYVALLIVAGALLLTGWYELLICAVVTDLLMGAGLHASAFPIMTLCACAIILARMLVTPHLLSTRSTLHI